MNEFPFRSVILPLVLPLQFFSVQRFSLLSLRSCQLDLVLLSSAFSVRISVSVSLFHFQSAFQFFAARVKLQFCLCFPMEVAS